MFDRDNLHYPTEVCWEPQNCAFSLGVIQSRVVAAQVEFESKCSKRHTTFQFQALSSRQFNLGLIGSTCTALPRHYRHEGRGGGSEIRDPVLEPLDGGDEALELGIGVGLGPLRDAADRGVAAQVAFESNY